jgi:beta-1,2-mannobiose phosphorylase / 1,2-beta-oligomannan phosphorylase
MPAIRASSRTRADCPAYALYTPVPNLGSCLNMRHLAGLAVLLASTFHIIGTESNDVAWTKYPGNPVIGGQYGTCFDVAVLKEKSGYRMWVSWRPQSSIALLESADGTNWSGPPRIVLRPKKETGWEDEVNRPVVVKREGRYHMWYTGQAHGHSFIGYATSADGAAWNRASDRPVVSPEVPWEKVATMCPHVLWDEAKRTYKMWYSAGDQYEPDAIGYATSADGLTWQKLNSNPVFRPAPSPTWDGHKVTAVQVQKLRGWYVMFYIGFRDVDHAQIGLARSRDGITEWQRHPANPIISPSPGSWDQDACYKPFAVFDGTKWLLWYNGRRGNVEQIGVAFHKGEELGFDKLPERER